MNEFKKIIYLVLILITFLELSVQNSVPVQWQSSNFFRAGSWKCILGSLYFTGILTPEGQSVNVPYTSTLASTPIQNSNLAISGLNALFSLEA